MPVPDKLFYKIGEVSKITGVEPYVLRYWETEFPFLRPRKNKSGQRVYVKKDLEMIIQVKRMLYQERYTIEGVRKRFGEGIALVPETKATNEPKSMITKNPAEILGSVKKRLREIVKQMR
ncbi:MAG: MerR family transcriptional regulator [Nitrospirae bacterium]|nr:MerR family transcriptional regulator [Nitrospirota bacterium]